MNLKRLNYTEPAMWRGVVTALIALLGAFGVTVTADLSALVDSLIVAASLALPLVQAVTTRASVVSPETADKDIRQAQALAVGEAQADLRNGPRDPENTGEWLERNGVTPQIPGKADHAAPE